MLYKKLTLQKSYNRHLIVGDIHGQFGILEKLLKDINYNSEKDMLYTVGDMIDRGDKSFEVVDFFTSHEHRHSILGNHEEMALHGNGELWLSNGGDTTLFSLMDSSVDVEWLRGQVKDLPIFLDVVCGDLEFRLVHAETNPMYDNEDIMMRLNGSIEDYRFQEEALWGRSIIYLYEQSPEYVDIKDDTDTFVGHTIVPRVKYIQSRTYLNVPMGQLAIIDVATKDVFYSGDFK